MPSNRPVVEFTENVPQTLALEYPRGKMVSTRHGERFLFSVDHGQKALFVDPVTASKIENLGLASREPFSITKTKAGFEVAKFGNQTDGTYTAPAIPERAQNQNGNHAPTNHTQTNGGPGAAIPNRKAPASERNGRSAASLLDEANVLVDTFHQALQRARKLYGDGIQTQEVRALVISAYIKQTREAA